MRLLADRRQHPAAAVEQLFAVAGERARVCAQAQNHSASPFAKESGLEVCISFEALASASVERRIHELDAQVQIAHRNFASE